MERKYKVNDKAAGDSTANAAQSKEVALEKLRKMEWKRNAQDPWHLARSNSRASDVQERKKYNKDEDNYFEGTGVQKTKKMRRPRTTEGPPSVPPGFTVDQASPGAPQVNAWAQKKGSALFQREDEIDEEDQVMKLVLEESLKSAEEDQKRRMERMKMTNLDLQASSCISPEKGWEEEFKDEDFHAKHYQADIQDHELHFVETDVKEEIPTANQRHRSIPPRARKVSHQEKSSPPSSNKKFDFSEPASKVPPSSVNNNARFSGGRALPRDLDNDPNNDDFFEPSRPQSKPSKPVNKVNETPNPLSLHGKHLNSSMSNNISGTNANSNSEDLATSFDTTLTFGDTQGLLEKIKEHELKSKGNTQDFQNETPSYLDAADSSVKKSSNPSEPSETDILLHSFIRHDPPSDANSFFQPNVPDMNEIKQSEPNELFTLSASPTYSSQNPNLVQGYSTHPMINTEQHSLVNGLVSSTLPGGVQISNGQDSSSSISGSPLQNMTPFGSLEKEISPMPMTGLQASSHIGNLPYQYPYSMENQDLTRQLQAMQLMNQNLPSPTNIDYSSFPSQVRGLMQGQPQYRLPNSNVMLPSLQGHTSPLLLQHQLQHAHLQQAQLPPGYMSQLMALDAARLQQSQLSTGIAESEEKASEEGNKNQSQVLNGNSLLAQNQAHLLAQTHQTEIPPQTQIMSQTPKVLMMTQTPQVPMMSQNPQVPMMSQTPQSQILLQTQAQLLAQAQAQLLTQNHQHLMNLQNHPQAASLQNQPQSIPQSNPLESSSPKQEELLQQQAMMAGRAHPTGKTAEEMYLEYLDLVQKVKRYEEQMQALPQMAQQPSWGMVAPSPGMPLGNQFFPVGMMPQIHPQLVQQSPNTGLTSPTQSQQSLSGLINAGQEMPQGSELNRAQEPAQTSVGRGRGRFPRD